VDIDARQGLLERIAEGEEPSIIANKPMASPTGNRRDRGDVADVDL
jgi:hypothetical protein